MDELDYPVKLESAPGEILNPLCITLAVCFYIEPFPLDYKRQQNGSMYTAIIHDKQFISWMK